MPTPCRLVSSKVTEEIRNYDQERKTHAIQNIELFKIEDRVRILKQRGTFEKGGKTFTK